MSHVLDLDFFFKSHVIINGGDEVGINYNWNGNVDKDTFGVKTRIR